MHAFSRLHFCLAPAPRKGIDLRRPNSRVKSCVLNFPSQYLLSVFIQRAEVRSLLPPNGTVVCSLPRLGHWDVVPARHVAQGGARRCETRLTSHGSKASHPLDCRVRWAVMRVYGAVSGKNGSRSNTRSPSASEPAVIAMPIPSATIA